MLPSMLSKRNLAAAIATAFALPACATNGAAWTYNPDLNAIGRIYYYERTNIDGTEDERVAVFRRDADNIEVYKENGLCENAALVTATMDWTTFSAKRIVGGRLLPNAEREEFAFLDWDKPHGELNMVVRLPNMEIRDAAPVRRTPWHLFDFDLASLTVAAPHLKDAGRDFSFGMALLWTAPATEDPLVWMGEVKAHYDGEEERLGHRSRRYTISGDALTGQRSAGREGVLWLDGAGGHVVDAILPVPNHDGYDDFRLRLIKVADGGDTEWTALLKAHFAQCEGDASR